MNGGERERIAAAVDSAIEASSLAVKAATLAAEALAALLCATHAETWAELEEDTFRCPDDDPEWRRRWRRYCLAANDDGPAPPRAS